MSLASYEAYTNIVTHNRLFIQCICLDKKSKNTKIRHCLLHHLQCSLHASISYTWKHMHTTYVWINILVIHSILQPSYFCWWLFSSNITITSKSSALLAGKSAVLFIAFLKLFGPFVPLCCVFSNLFLFCSFLLSCHFFSSFLFSLLSFSSNITKLTPLVSNLA